MLVKVICNVKLSVADQQLKSVQSVVGLTTGNSGGKINCRSIGVLPVVKEWMHKKSDFLNSVKRPKMVVGGRLIQ